MTQLYIYIYPLFFRFYSHVGHYRVLNRVPYAIQFPGGVVVMDPPANAGESKTQEINSTKSKASSRISRLIAKKHFLNAC